MNLEDYRTVFAASTLVLILIVATPTLTLIVSSQNENEGFSEFYLLSSTHMAEEYPFNIGINETYPLFVGISNHMGKSSYYLVYVKFRNQTEPLPNVTISEPSSLPPLYELRTMIEDNEDWEVQLSLKILTASVLNGTMFVNSLSINDTVFSLSSSTRWNLEHNGFYYQLFFELWIYDLATQDFKFHNRLLTIWLNMTG